MEKMDLEDHRECRELREHVVHQDQVEFQDRR